MNWIKHHKFLLSIILFAALTTYSFRFDIAAGDASEIVQIIIYYCIFGYSVKWVIAKIERRNHQGKQKEVSNNAG